MKLEAAKGLSSDTVTGAQVRQLFRDDAKRGDFAILSSEEESYIQAAGNSNGSYDLEYRNGDEEHHFKAPGKWKKSDVERAFMSYLAGDTRWKNEFPWQKLAKKPWWKFW